MCKDIKNTDFTNLVEVLMFFSDNDVCKEYLAERRWPEKIVCPHCEHDGKIYTMKNGYKCSKCRKPFSVTKDTIFENSPIPLQKWFAAIWLITSHKKGVSSLQIHRDLGVTQKSGWFMLQRIRYALKNKSFSKPLENVVEADETYVGGKNKNRHAHKKVKNAQGRSTKDKTPVFGMLERKGEVMAMKVDNVTKKEIQPIILENVSEDATIMTDEWSAYNGLSKVYSHHVVKHAKGEYVVVDCHTNTIEGYWSLFKRMIYGIYHYVSDKHLQKYVDEMSFRYNTRTIHCTDRFNNMVTLSNTRLTYKQLTEN